MAERSMVPVGSRAIAARWQQRGTREAAHGAARLALIGAVVAGLLVAAAFAGDLWLAAVPLGLLVVAGAARLNAREAELARVVASRERLLADAEAAARRERTRLAEALHDDALQRLFAARQDVEDGMESGDVDSLRHALAALGEATDGLRDLTRAMHHRRLSAGGLRLAVVGLGADTARRAHLETEIEVGDRAAGVFDELVLTFVRELLSNVARHAQAGHLRVTITRDLDDDVVVEVADDGRGMSPSDLERARLSGHLGHAALRDRVATVGGTLQIDSAPGAGTRVRIVLPAERLDDQRRLQHARERAAMVS